jgi:hypothetical protein
LRIEEQETRLILPEHDDVNDDEFCMAFKGISLRSNRAQICQMSQSSNGRKTEIHKHSQTTL